MEYSTVEEISGPWTVQFDPERGAPREVRFEELTDWTACPDEGVKYYSGTATYTTSFDFTPELGKRYWLRLNRVKDVGIAAAHLNGADLGVLWTAPFRTEITGALRQGKNDLDIIVVNSWLNRLIGDRGKPQEERYTKTNIRIREDWQLRESGLLGPVEILDSRGSPTHNP